MAGSEALSELLGRTLEALLEPWLLWDAHERIAAASPRCFESMGVPASQLLGATDVTFPQLLARSGSVATFGPTSAVIRTARGEELERRSRPLPDGGRLDVFVDLAEQRAQAQRREQLLGVAIHDLRAPLANVRSYAGLLLGGKVPELDPRVRRSAEVIARNADRALRLLQMFFDAQRAETGELDIDRQPVVLASLLHETVAARRATAAEKGVELTAAPLPAGASTVLGDRERLLSAVGALLDNAIARAPPNGRVEILLEERPREAWLGFAEAGTPLGPEEMREAFDRDAQALKEKRLGPGYAVAVAKAIAQTHGGTAGVSSAPGRTVFSLTLPR